MYEWMKKLHIYAGLLSYTAFTVWGVAGVLATLRPPPGERPPQQRFTETIDFEAPGDLNDQELARLMIAKVDPPFLKNTVPRHRRDDENRLTMTYYTPNGRRRLVLLEEERQILFHATPTTFFQFLDSMHAASFRHSRPVPVVKLWGAYNQFSLWAVIFMTLSGVYMWLATRPGLLWTRYTLGAASAAFVLFYVLVR